MRLKKMCFLIGLIGVSWMFLLGVGNEVQAKPASRVETDGTLQFYGKYESKLEPHPHPPGGSETVPPTMGSQKPGKSGGKLPQAGQLLTQHWFWLGSSIVLLSLIMLKKKGQSDFSKSSYDFE